MSALKMHKEYRGGDRAWVVVMDGEDIYLAKDSRDADLFMVQARLGSMDNRGPSENADVTIGDLVNPFPNNVPHYFGRARSAIRESAWLERYRDLVGSGEWSAWSLERAAVEADEFLAEFDKRFGGEG